MVHNHIIVNGLYNVHGQFLAGSEFHQVNTTIHLLQHHIDMFTMSEQIIHIKHDSTPQTIWTHIERNTGWHLIEFDMKTMWQVACHVKVIWWTMT